MNNPITTYDLTDTQTFHLRLLKMWVEDNDKHHIVNINAPHADSVVRRINRVMTNGWYMEEDKEWMNILVTEYNKDL